MTYAAHHEAVNVELGQGCCICHLDRPYGSWPTAVTSVPAAAMKLPHHGIIRSGGPANLVVFRGRKYSELLSRPQHDRVTAPPMVPCMPLQAVTSAPVTSIKSQGTAMCRCRYETASCSVRWCQPLPHVLDCKFEGGLPALLVGAELWTADGCLHA